MPDGREEEGPWMDSVTSMLARARDGYPLLLTLMTLAVVITHTVILLLCSS